MAQKFFDSQWYLATYPDVADAVSKGIITPEQHFEMYGVQEGRSPSALFDPSYYLAKNQDVAGAVSTGAITAYQHFEQFGHIEGREASPYFNVKHYLDTNPDVAKVVEAKTLSAYEHFHLYGASEDRSPAAFFNPQQYLAANPDVAAAVEDGVISATEHFRSFGVQEGRDPSSVIALGAYLAENTDVAAAVDDGAITALEHLLTFGIAEDRDLGNGVDLALFANDPVYKEAITAGRTDVALARVNEVAPFLPEFEAPEGFELPADWPIPQGYVHPQGTLLAVPEGWSPAEPTRLPGSFEQPFALVNTDGIVTFTGSAEGDITMVKQEGGVAFARDGFLTATVPADGSVTISLAEGQHLVAPFEDLKGMTIAGAGTVSAVGTEGNDIIDLSTASISGLTIEGLAGNDTIAIANGQTALGGEGADTFVIAASAGVPSVITVDDYKSSDGDVIDLRGVKDVDLATMEVRGAEHDGTQWNWEGYAGNSVGIWFTDSAANVQVTGARADTMTFVIPETSLMPDGATYSTVKVNIGASAVVRANDTGEVLVGGAGTQALVGGAGEDAMIGGGGIDFFVLNNAATSNVNAIDVIVDFDVANDVIAARGTVLPGNIVSAAVDTMNGASLSTALTATNFQANGAAAVTSGGRTYLVLNDGTAGYNEATDVVVDITSAGPDLSTLKIIGIPEIDMAMGV